MTSATVAERTGTLDLIVFGPIIHHINSFYPQKKHYAIIPAFAGVATHPWLIIHGRVRRKWTPDRRQSRKENGRP